MTKSVLLVDDEKSITEILATWLEEAGYDTAIAGNGLDGLMSLNTEKPDLVIADIMMPQIDGYELCRMIREMSEVPIMILSGLSKESDKKQGFVNGADDYLTKPVSMGRFLEHVSTLMLSKGSHPQPRIDVLRPDSPATS